MAIHYSPGYTLPPGDQPLTHARILHSGLWLSGGTWSATSEAADKPATAAGNSLTWDRWRPAAVPAVLSYGHPVAAAADCICIGAHTAGSEAAALRLMRGGATRSNLLQRSQDFSAAYWPTEVGTVTRNTAWGRAPDGTTSVALLDNTGGTTACVRNATATVAASATNDYFVSLYVQKSGANSDVTLNTYYSPFVAEDSVTFNLDTGAIAGAPYPADVLFEDAGDGWFRIGYRIGRDATGTKTSIVVRIWPSGRADTSSASLVWGAQLEAGTAATSYIATTTAAASSPRHAISGWISPADDMPVMLLFPSTSQQSWYLEVTGAACDIGVMAIGPALQMPRPLYGGHTPLQMARQVTWRTNVSDSGEVLGRSRQSTMRQSAIAWQNLPAAWVRDSWYRFQDGATEPFFLAWRPGSFGEVALCVVDEMPAPQNAGVRDLMSVEMALRAHSWD